nr:immunoglobulin heavy chain junction region [Macaca mulatta]
CASGTGGMWFNSLDVW